MILTYVTTSVANIKQMPMPCHLVMVLTSERGEQKDAAHDDDDDAIAAEGDDDEHCWRQESCYD